VLVVLVLKNCELSTPELPPGMHSIVEQGFALLVLLVVKNACPAAILPEGSDLSRICRNPPDEL
jgi:hypothetical protein